MLRPRPDGAVELDVHAAPKSSRDAIGKVRGGRLECRVKAAPVGGKANAAIVKLLAKALGLPREAVELVRGQTGKRKTVRITGLDLAEVAAALGLEVGPSSTAPIWLGVGLAAIAAAPACTNPRELPITVILPADQSDYEQADNASLVLRPSGETYTFAVDGLDFSLELEGDPSTEAQQLELYLARGDELIAWGSTAPFATAGADIGLALFLGRPGLLSTWPEVLDAPDPDVLGAEAVGRGMLLVQADGDTFLLNQFTLALESGARLPDTIDFAVGDGGLFSAADGSVVRLAWEQTEPLAWRYDPSSDLWSELTVDGAADIGVRPGAAALVDPDRTRLYLIAGGGMLDGVAIDLIRDGQDVLAAAPIADLALDAPRDGATALWIPDGDDPTADVLLVGGDQSGPLAVLTSAGTSVGPTVLWRGCACAIRTASDSGVSVLCVGGTIDDVATADALSIDVVPAASAAVEVRESFLPAALADPRMLADDAALYAQGDARWFVIGRDAAGVSEPDSAPLRGAGGDLVSLPNGVTFVVGGVDSDGVPLDRWQVFTPAIEN